MESKPSASVFGMVIQFAMSNPVDVRMLMQQIRQRIRKRSADRERMRAAFQSALPPVSEDETAPENAGQALRAQYEAIGNMPPEPPTLRGHAGAWLVRFVRRSLFWYTQQLREFGASVIERSDQQSAALRRVAEANERNSQLGERLWTQTATLVDEVAQLRQALDIQQTEINRRLDLAVEAERKARELLSEHVESGIALWRALEGRLVAESANWVRLSDRIASEVDNRKALQAQLESRDLLREQQQQALETEMEARKRLASGLDAEIAARERLQRVFESWRHAQEHAGRQFEAVTAALQQGLAAEMGAREELASRVEGYHDSLQQGLAAETPVPEEPANRTEERHSSMQQGLAAEMGAREELANRVEGYHDSLRKALAAETQAREELANRTEERHSSMQQGLAAEMGAREELANRVERYHDSQEKGLAAEMGAREELSQAVAANAEQWQRLAPPVRDADLAIHHLKAELVSQSSRITILLEEARKKLSAVSAEKQLTKIVGEDKHALDGLYLALEERFRGSRHEIEERQRFYLPFLQQQKIGVRRMPVLDLGCGRGEWLGLLSETGREARGVDTNRIFVADCLKRRLKVTEADVIEYLRKQPDASLGAVTGFHIIEHLPFDMLVKMFDETVRVLKPGGLAIFESPNPQNVLVGSHNFYIDPTHRNPLPAITVQLILESRGLDDVQIHFLHPYPESFLIQGDSELTQRFNEFFFGAQDYAVIGRRV